MHIVIIGNGISGITAARNIRKQSKHRITVISSESKYFFSRTALMYVYMGHMKPEHMQAYEPWFWKKNNIDLVFAHVTQVDTKVKQIHLAEQVLDYDVLIIASGSKPAFYNWKGQSLQGVQGLYSLQDLQLMKENTKKCTEAVVVGGGLIGVELAEMLHSRNIQVHILVREKTYWSQVLPEEEAALVAAEIQANGVTILFESEIQEIEGKDAQVSAVRTTCGKEIPCQFVGIATGVEPNIDFLKNTDIQISKGVLVDTYLQTNISDVYAIGDCAQHIQPPTGRKSLEQVWYTGRIMGETVAQTICGNPTPYNPGVWFNSAKFFNLEYVVYGKIEKTISEDVQVFYWEDAALRISFRLHFCKKTGSVIGVQSLGMRLRQNVCVPWIENKISAHEAMLQLDEADFNPEFYSKRHTEIIRTFLNTFGKKGSA